MEFLPKSDFLGFFWPKFSKIRNSFKNLGNILLIYVFKWFKENVGDFCQRKIAPAQKFWHQKINFRQILKNADFSQKFDYLKRFLMKFPF